MRNIEHCEVTNSFQGCYGNRSLSLFALVLRMKLTLLNEIYSYLQTAAVFLWNRYAVEESTVILIPHFIYFLSLLFFFSQDK